MAQTRRRNNSGGKKAGSVQLNSELESQLKHLDGLADLHLSICAQMLKADGGKIFPLDILASAVIKRSMALISGFTTLVRTQNYTCATPLLRLQMDNCFRFFAAFIVDNPHEMAQQVLKGTPIRKIKDRSGQYMTDKHLVNMLSIKFEWMQRVYESTSGFIHLSDKHLFSVFDCTESNGLIGLRVSANDKMYP